MKNTYQTSLPKQPYNPQYNSTSTRCMSSIKPPQNNNQVILKPMAPPKQLTVHSALFSITWGRATTKVLFEKC